MCAVQKRFYPRDMWNSNILLRKRELKEKWAKNVKHASHKISNNEKMLNLINSQRNAN